MLKNKIELKCGHGFCKDCLINEWNFRVKNGEFLQCSMQGCNAAIEIHLI